MNTKKAILPLSIIAAIALLTTLGFVFFAGRNVYHAIPKGAIAVIEAADWQKLANKLNSTGAGREIGRNYALAKLAKEQTTLQNFLVAGSSLNSKVLSGEMVVSVHLSAADDIDFLFTLKSGIGIDDIYNYSKTGKNIRGVNKRIFKKEQLLDVTLADGSQITFVKLHGILSFSFTSFLAENAVTALLTGGGLDEDKEFKKVVGKTKLTADFRLIFNFKSVDVLYPVFVKPDKTGLLADLKNSIAWGLYDFTIANNKVDISGLARQTTWGKIKILNIAESPLLTMIPDNAAYASVSESDTVNDAEKPTDNLLDTYFKSWPGATKAFIILEPLKEDFTDQNILLVEVKDKQGALQSLKKLAASDGKNNAVDTFMSQQIFNLQGGAALNRFFGSSFVQFKNVFFSVNNQVAIFANTVDELKFVLEKISKKEVLQPADILSEENAGKAINQINYLNPQRSALLFRGLVKDSSELPAYIAQFGKISEQVSLDKNGWQSFKTSIAIAGANQSMAGLLWRTGLKAPGQIPAQIVPLSGVENKGVFIQDTLNNIYLINSSGNILFTKNIEEKVMGKVQTLDYYNNGENQYAFNTAAHVYLIDQYGNDVASYPLRLSHQATAGMLLLKDTRSDKYRYYLPCNNGTIYGYEGSGKPLPGWSPKNGVGTINSELLAFPEKSGYRIAALNTDGKLNCWASNGTVVWSVNNLPVTSSGVFLVKNTRGFKFLLAQGNSLTEISSDGNDNIKPLVDTALYFATAQVSDSGYLYFFSNTNQIRSYTGENEFQHSLGLKGAVITDMVMCSDLQSSYLKVLDNISGTVYYYSLFLKPLANFKITGTDYSVFGVMSPNQSAVWINPDLNGYVSCSRIN